MRDGTHSGFLKMETLLNHFAEEEPSSQQQLQASLLSIAFKRIVGARILITLSVLLCLAQSLLALKAAKPEYNVQALLIQNNEPSSSLRSAGSQVSLTTFLAGSGTTSLPEIDEFQVLLGSPEVAAILDRKYDLLHDVFRDSWDKKNNRWYPPRWKDRLHYEIVEALGGMPHQEINDYDLAKYLGSAVQFQRSDFGSVMSISIITDRPEDAKRWLNILLSEVSDIIRSQMINERQNYVNYLQQELSQSSLTTSRDATISVLADQFRTLMILKSAKTFPLQQIQPPTAGQSPVNKSVSISSMIGIVTGALIAGLLIVCGISDATFKRLCYRLWKKLSGRY